MTTPSGRDPERLREDPALPSALRKGLHLAASPEVDAATRERLAKSLGLASEGGGGPAGLGGRHRYLGASVACVVVAAIVGGWLAVRRGAPPVSAPSLDPSPTAVAPNAPVSEPTSAFAPPTDTGVAAGVLAAPTDTGVGSGVVADPPSAPRAREVHSTAAPPSAPSQSSGATEALPDEASLLRAARGALHAGEPRRALQLLDVYPRRFPNGMFGQERDVLRIDALVALGRSAEAQAAARAFLVEHPESAHRAHVESILTKE